MAVVPLGTTSSGSPAVAHQKVWVPSLAIVKRLSSTPAAIKQYLTGKNRASSALGRLRSVPF